MKKVAILFIVLLTSSFLFAQNTYVPDDKFEQALIDLGYDTTLDDSVLTANISGVTTLDVSNKEISDLTGIEAFTSLTSLECSDNQLTSLDVSKNTALTSLNCWSNQLASLDVSKNTALNELQCWKNQLTSLDVSKNKALSYLSCEENQLTSLDVSSNTTLTYLECGGNQLTSLNMRNGVTDSLSTFIATNNPNLTCIETLDPVYATANWTSANGKIDAGVTFAYICGVDVDGVATYNNNGIKAITFNVELPTHSLPDTNISLAFWKSGAENNECTGCNGRDTVSMRKLSDNHWEATVGLDTTLVAGDVGESMYWYHYVKTIPDYKINEDLERFKSEPNPDGLRQLEPGWHKETSLVNKDTVIAWNNIAPVNFDWVSA
ncbi:MAG: leucine-rich repeat domain-containing protein, partial [Candidatus Marinimicrobia bacterium]|nr:leucine-rich repeat domain-containing protein [Candidatus Neomarinimicrobiota bacterium]